MARCVSINYDWVFSSDQNPEQKKVNIPHNAVDIPYHYFQEQMLFTDATYQKMLTVDQQEDEVKVLLRFEGVMNHSKIYVDQLFVHQHFGGFSGFEVDITEFVKGKQKIELEVVLSTYEEEDTPPFGHLLDYLTYGGIYREVELIYLKENDLTSFLLRTEKIQDHKAFLHLELDFLTPPTQNRLVQLHFTYEDTTVISLALTNKKHQIHEFCIENIVRWDLENPALYQVSLFDENDVLYQTNYGFRTINADENGFYLNNKKIKLLGLNRHQSYPYVGYAMPKSAQIKDADLLKYTLGVNIVRSSHYPACRHFLNRCDEIGLLVFEEIPGWQHIGGDLWKNRALENTKQMITEHYHHPSIVFWGVRINESKDDNPFYKNLAEAARNIDPTRLLSGARAHKKSPLFDDVYAYNNFTDHDFEDIILDPSEVMQQKSPYLITEYNGHMYPCKKFDPPDRRTEHALRHLRMISAANEKEDILGCIGWCLFDYNTHKDFGAGDHICYHGVLDMFRIPKYAAYAYSAQQDHTPVLKLLSRLNIGDYNACKMGKLVVLSNCDQIDLYYENRKIQSFFPDAKKYTLNHPPFILDDLIGDRLEVEQGLKKEEANLLKEVYSLREQNLTLSDSIQEKMSVLQKKKGWNDRIIDSLYNQYVGGWGQEVKNYRLIGLKDQKEIIQKEIMTNPKVQYIIQADSTTLVEENTYDVTRIEIIGCDESYEELPYLDSVIHVSCDDELEIIGPKSFSLVGGSRAFWIKSTGQNGTFSVFIQTPTETKTILIQVERKAIE